MPDDSYLLERLVVYEARRILRYLQLSLLYLLPELPVGPISHSHCPTPARALAARPRTTHIVNEMTKKPQRAPSLKFADAQRRVLPKTQVCVEHVWTKRERHVGHFHALIESSFLWQSSWPILVAFNNTEAYGSKSVKNPKTATLF